MKPVWWIAVNTAKEILRDRVLYGLVLFALGLLGVSVLLGSLSFAEQARIVTDFGLVAAQLGCGMLAIFVGGSLVWKEMERQTILTILSKPLSRTQFILGKFFGMAAILLLVDILISTFLAALCVAMGTFNPQQLFISQLGVMAESLLLLAIVVFLGVFVRPILTTIFALSLWLIGHGVNDIWYFSQKSQSDLLKFVGKWFSKVFPNLEYFNFKAAVVHGEVISSQAVLSAFCIWGAWTLILLIGALWVFENRDFT
ncbi:MAG: ABC transporter permease [Oligoflexia bacterium]|nr:ABC transporter permease [Oligoflexia bacterium]